MYFHFETIRTYTGSLLSLFGDLETQTTLSNGKIHTSRVPIQYSNREKSDIINQLTYEQIFSANSQILPRAVLLFNSMTPARDRAKNKFFKIANIKINDETLQYQFNSIPYNFEYQIIVQTRGMSEAAQIIEQVCSYFNPSFNMKIREIPFEGIEPTSIRLELTDTQIEQQDIDDYSTNIVTITFGLTLSGNLYPCIKDSKIIKKIQVFLSEGNYNRTTSIESDENSTILNQYTAKIKDIVFEDNKIKAIYESQCEKMIKFNFEWYINEKPIVFNTQEIPYILKEGDIVKVRAYTDLTSSDFFEKEFFKDDLLYNINIKNINFIPFTETDLKEYINENTLLYNGVLEVEFEDLNPKNVSYTYKWKIDGVLQKDTNKSIKYNLNTEQNTQVKFKFIEVSITCSDGRKASFEKYMN